MRRRRILFGLAGVGAAIAAGGAWAGRVAAKPLPAIFWTNYGVSGTGGTIGRAAVTGGRVAQNFVRGANGPVGVAVHGGYLYWSNASDRPYHPSRPDICPAARRLTAWLLRLRQNPAVTGRSVACLPPPRGAPLAEDRGHTDRDEDAGDLDAELGDVACRWLCREPG